MVKRDEKGPKDIPLGGEVSAEPVAIPEKKAPEKDAPEDKSPEDDRDPEADFDKKFMEDYGDISMDDLISKGYVQHVFEVTEGLDITIRTLRKKEELDIKKRIGEYDGAQIYVLDETNTNTIAYCVMEINGEPLPDGFEDRRKAIDDLSDVICVAIIDEFRSLNKALVILLKGSSKNSLARRLLGPELI